MNPKNNQLSFKEQKIRVQLDFADRAGLTDEQIISLTEWWNNVPTTNALQTLMKSDKTIEEKMLLTLGVGIDMGMYMVIGLEARP